jgi:Cu(I)/Ag(I) efflux system membrane fusion protein
MGKETVLNATFSINQNKTSVVSAKINGRIEKIYHNVTGEMVKEGEPLNDLYSRDLLLAQEELLLTSGKNGIAAKGLMRAAKNKLLLWGMSEAQVDKLMKTRKANEVVTVHSAISGTLTSISMREGDFVMEGQVLLQVSDLSSLWVEAQVYRNESSMTTGDDLLILPEAFPGDQVHGHHAYITPEAQGGGRFNLLRIEIDNAAGKYQPGMQATVVARSEMNETYALPVDAVIRSKDHAVAWVKSRDGSFEARMIGTGMENKDMIEITSGLGEGDSVVVSGAYLIHSEYVFKKGKQAMSDMKM